MNEEYAALLERETVVGVVNQLFIGTDNRDWEKVKSCFAEAVLFDMTSMTGGEPKTLSSQQIAASWEQGLRALEAIHHQTGNFVVDINGNEAKVYCYGIALHYLPNKSNQNTRTFVGSYDFHLTKTGKTWRIDQFKFNLKFIDGNANLESSQ